MVHGHGVAQRRVRCGAVAGMFSSVQRRNEWTSPRAQEVLPAGSQNPATTVSTKRALNPLAAGFAVTVSGRAACSDMLPAWRDCSSALDTMGSGVKVLVRSTPHSCTVSMPKRMTVGASAERPARQDLYVYRRRSSRASLLSIHSRNIRRSTFPRSVRGASLSK